MSRLPPDPYKPLPTCTKDEDQDPNRTRRHGAAEWHLQSNGQLGYKPQELSSVCDTILVRARKKLPTPGSEDAAQAAADAAVGFKIRAEALPDSEIRPSRWYDALGVSTQLHGLTGQTICREPDVEGTNHKTLQDELRSALATADRDSAVLSRTWQPRDDRTRTETSSASTVSKPIPIDENKVTAFQKPASEHNHQAGPSSQQHTTNSSNLAQPLIQPTIQTYKCPACCSFLHIDAAGTRMMQTPPAAGIDEAPAKEKKHKSLRGTTIRFSLPTPKPGCVSDDSRHVWMPVNGTVVAIGMQELRDRALADCHVVKSEHTHQRASAEPRYFETPSSKPEKDPRAYSQRKGKVAERPKLYPIEPEGFSYWR